MNNKKRLIIDFDDTLVQSGKTIVDIYNSEHPNNYIQYHKNYLWNFKGILPEDYYDRAIDLFCEQKFYDRLEPMPNAIEVLQRLQNYFELVICTKHNPDGISMKHQYIRNYFSFIPKTIFLVQDGYDKSLIQGEIIIDDKIECLIGGNRELRLLFGNYGYNQIENVNKEIVKQGSQQTIPLRVNNWKDVEKILMSMR